MSSESDDDFQSADEGSDLEEPENVRAQKPVLPPPVKQEIEHSSEDEEEDHKEKTEVNRRGYTKRNKSKEPSPEPCDLNPEISSEEVYAKEESSLMGALKNLSLQVSEQLTLHDRVPEPQSDDSEGEEEFDEDAESIEDKFKTFPGGIGDNRKCQVEEGGRTTSKPVRDSERIEKTDQEEEVQESILETSASGDSKQSSGHSTERVDFVVEGGESIRNDECEKVESSSKADQVKNLTEVKPLVQEHESEELGDSKVQQAVPLEKVDEKKSADVHPGNKKTRPIRESKIGMKKPREKLGERLGAKKLGSRIERKPMEGIGSKETPKAKDVPVSEKKPSQINLEDSNSSKETECKERLQQSFWELEEERWQQVQSQDGKGKVEHFESKESDSDWGTSWGNWGTTLITAASSFTQEVGRGVGSIMDTVEGSLGVPDPETMAREIIEREKEVKSEVKKQEFHSTVDKERLQEHTDLKDEGVTNKNSLFKEGNNTGGSSVRDYGLGGFSSLGSLVSGVSGVFETASNKVLMGGLDTLEVIGRKAMDVIQDGDPGLRKKRAFLANAKPNLSMVLQEARHRAAEEERDQREGGPGRGGRASQSMRPTLDQAWETTEGCVHLEALSLVARQCESKMSSMLQNMPHYLTERIQAANVEIKNACELEEESPLEKDFVTHVEEIMPLIGLPLQPQKINNAWKSVDETVSLIREAGVVDGPTAERELYGVLAALVAQLAAVLHKGAELALITPDADPLTIAIQFKELSSVLCNGIENTADQICGIITMETSAANTQVNNTITNIYLQSANGNGYIQQSMMYLASVLQYSNTKQMAAEL